MTNWKYELQLKDLLANDELTKKQTIKLGQKMYERLYKFTKTIDESEDDDYWLCENLLGEAESFLMCETCEEINDVLDYVYDLCDEYRVWVK